VSRKVGDVYAQTRRFRALTESLHRERVPEPLLHHKEWSHKPLSGAVQVRGFTQNVPLSPLSESIVTQRPIPFYSEMVSFAIQMRIFHDQSSYNSQVSSKTT